MWASRQKKEKTERVTGLGRRTKEEIVKWNQMTALRFQTEGKTSDIPGLPSGASSATHTTSYIMSNSYSPGQYLVRQEKKINWQIKGPLRDDGQL